MQDDNQSQNPIVPKDEASISEMAVPEPIPVQSTDPTPIDIAPVAPELRKKIIKKIFELH